MEAYVEDIEEATEDNEDFRRVLYTGTHLQLLLMALQPGEAIGDTTHADRTSSSASSRERAKS